MKGIGVAVAAVAGVCALFLAATPAVAHHSFAAEFDGNDLVTVVGTITKIEWVNPHSWLYIDVKNDQGKIESYAIEFAAPNGLIRRGWRKTDLPVGATVTVKAFRAKGDPYILGAGSAGNIRLPDGKILFADAPPDGR